MSIVDIFFILNLCPFVMYVFNICDVIICVFKTYALLLCESYDHLKAFPSSSLLLPTQVVKIDFITWVFLLLINNPQVSLIKDIWNVRNICTLQTDWMIVIIIDMNKSTFLRKSMCVIPVCVSKNLAARHHQKIHDQTIQYNII